MSGAARAAAERSRMETEEEDVAFMAAAAADEIAAKTASDDFGRSYTGVATVTGTGTPISVDTRQRRTPVEKSVRMEEATVASAARRRNVKRRAKRKQKLARLSRAEAAP